MLSLRLAWIQVSLLYFLVKNRLISSAWFSIVTKIVRSIKCTLWRFEAQVTSWKESPFQLVKVPITSQFDPFARSGENCDFCFSAYFNDVTALPALATTFHVG